MSVQQRVQRFARDPRADFVITVRRPMSPLLSTRPSVSVTHRLLAACVVTLLLAAVVALGAGDPGRPMAAAPTFLAVGAVCAALVAYLLYASARAVEDCRLRWMAAGATVACAGLLAGLLGERSLFPYGGPLTETADAMTARYLTWHAALAVAAILAVAKVAPTRGRLLAFLGASLLVLVWCSVGNEPFGDLVAFGGGYSAAARLASLVLVVVQGGVAVLWWRSEEGIPPWGAMCMIAALGLSAADSLAYVVATEPYQDAWWASLTLRAAQFAIPAVGLVMGIVGFADKLRDLQDEIGANFAAESARAAREEELAGADRARRERLAGRIRRLIAGEGLDVALQPIVDLASGRVVGAEALARFTGADGETIPTEECFLDAHLLGLGNELELAAISLALESHERVPEGRYLAVNASPALLATEELRLLLTAHDRRPLVVELTEHEQVEDYFALARSLEELRAHGIRVAIDDVGSGFSSFRHVTRVNPDILKLDRSLVCGIDDDPVRQSLAAAIVTFAADVGAVVVSEGIESEAELACLRELAVGLGQGFFLGRPNLGSVDAEPAAPVAVA
jgi:EAL domain-containing protein (putative c-di-GMP-specific phosphodiesterase class I)